MFVSLSGNMDVDKVEIVAENKISIKKKETKVATKKVETKVANK